jgi:hypothetical protein
VRSAQRDDCRSAGISATDLAAIHHWPPLGAVSSISAADSSKYAEIATRLPGRAILTSPTTIAWCLVHMGRFAEAEPTLVSAVSGLEAEKGSAFWTTQFAYRSLRDLHQATGRATQADLIDKKVLH